MAWPIHNFEHQAIIRYVQTWFLVRRGANSAIHILMLKSQCLVKYHLIFDDKITSFLRMFNGDISILGSNGRLFVRSWPSTCFGRAPLWTTSSWRHGCSWEHQCFGVAFYFRKPPYSPYSDNLFICSIPVGGSCTIRFWSWMNLGVCPPNLWAFLVGTMMTKHGKDWGATLSGKPIWECEW